MTAAREVSGAEAVDGAACDRCLARTWLVGRLAGRLDVVRHRALDLLELPDEELIAAVEGHRVPSLAGELARFDPAAARAAIENAELQALCRCDARYPAALLALEAPPAVLHVAGGLERFLSLCSAEPVAIVGARASSEYGRQVARSLAAALSAAGVTVLSGMARGIDSSAHEGALAAGGRTVAVMPACADRPYPAGARRLHARMRATAALVSELGPGAEVRRWSFRGRNRIIAALSAMTVVVEATRGSGSLVTASLARELGRPLAAVPGRVTSELAAGPNELLARGAAVVRDAQDVLDHLYGAGMRKARRDERPAPTEAQRALLEALADGAGTSVALTRAGLGASDGLAALAELELGGWVRRGPGGAMVVIP